MRAREPHSGFTLIELMITVVVIGLLAAIAYPSYQRHLENVRRATGQADMLELAQWLERQFTVNHAYNTGTLPFSTSPREGAAMYTITVERDESSYTITAVPTRAQSRDRCGSLKLTHTNTRTASGVDATDCWP